MSKKVLTYQFKQISTDLNCLESNIIDCLQPQLQYPSKVSPVREQFWVDYHNKGYSYVIKKYAGIGIKATIKKGVVKCLQRLRLINIVKKFLGK